MTAATVAKLREETPQRTRTLWQSAASHILSDKLTLTAMLILGIMTLLCILGPPVVENVLELDVNRIDIPNKFLPLGAKGHILGTDHLGRDQLIRLLYGGRVSLAIAYSASVMTILIGVALGLIAGYYGGRVDDLITWIITTLNSVPALFLLLIAAAFWTPSTELLIIILALLGWIGTCRLVRGEVLSLKEHEYILAARAVGGSNFRLLVYHILPNVLPIVIVTMTIIAGNLILIESGLSFFGGRCAGANTNLGEHADRLALVFQHRNPSGDLAGDIDHGYCTLFLSGGRWPARRAGPTQCLAIK